MRISDWSLDVCSSDLAGTDEAKPASRDLVVRDSQLPFHPRLGGVVAILGKQRLAALDRVAALLRVQTLPVALAQDHEVGVHPLGGQVHPGVAEFAVARHRSEEHTSELQSLMRISYALFSLNKKNTIY